MNLLHASGRPICRRLWRTVVDRRMRRVLPVLPVVPHGEAAPALSRARSKICATCHEYASGMARETHDSDGLAAGLSGFPCERGRNG